MAPWIGRLPASAWQDLHAEFVSLAVQLPFTTDAARVSALWHRVHSVPAPFASDEFGRPCSVPSVMLWHASHAVRVPAAESVHTASACWEPAEWWAESVPFAVPAEPAWMPVVGSYAPEPPWQSRPSPQVFAFGSYDWLPFDAVRSWHRRQSRWMFLLVVGAPTSR